MQNNKSPNRGGLGVRRPGIALASLVGVALATLAVANPVSLVKRTLSSRNARRIAAAILVALAGSVAVAAYAVFSSVPGRIQVAPVSVVVHSAAALPAEVQALEAGTAPLLFDRDTRSAHVAFADQQIDANLDRPTEIRAIKVYGPAPYELTVAALQGGTWTPIPGLSGLKLGRLDQGWNEFTASQPVTAQTLRFELTLIAGGKGKTATADGLAELEIWGTGDHALVSGTALVGAMQTGNASGGQSLPAQARAYAATPESGVIGKDGQTFRVTLDRPAARFKRAWLSYEAYGLAQWISPVRRINGLAVQGGVFTFAGSDWTPFVEPIHPDWLVAGGNRIEFTLPPNAGGTYSVRNVRIVGELDDGANFIARATTTVAGIENDTPALIDGDLASEWSPYADPRSKTGKPELTLYFDRTTQLDTLSIRLVNALAGTLSVDLLVGGQWQTAGLPTINGSKLAAGWNPLSGFAQVPADAVRLTFLNGTGSPGEIHEITASGSGVNGPRVPDIEAAYPDAGQFYGRQAYLRGYLSVPDNGSGPAVVTIANRTIPTPDGAFGVVVSKDEVGYANQADGEAWQVQIDAVYPDGQKLARIVKLTQQYDAASTQGVLPSVVNPGFSAVVVGGDASLDIDPDAVDKPMDIKITPLKEPELPPLDPGMTNVTPGPFRGYRFTPHGAKFKKHIKVTIPYDPALIPSGLNEQDVKTYFFDTELNRWVVLDRYRVDNGKRKVTSLTNHFTDMINATLTVPDHPETTSYNATQMKDIKAADPGAGINLMEPPKPNNMGDARLSYPIEIPPGRLGMQPQLGIQYNSSGGNGWLGLGWDLSTPSISIDTRWGVPRYDSDKETETYLLNGEMLTPVAHRGALQERNLKKDENTKRFYTRVEGAFQRIIRHGNSPKDYWWEVTDKNGVTNIYGGENNARHDGSTLGGDKGTFRWALRKTVDTHGNTVVYHYDKPDHAGVSGSQVLGQQLYISRIAYTGSGNTEGRYSIVFKRVSERPDISIDARGGFKQVTADLLQEVEVRYRNDDNGAGELVRRYELLYTEGAFKKTLLDKVVQYGADGTTKFNEHAFAYYDDIRTPETLAYRGFTPADSVETGRDDLKFNTPGGTFKHTVLGGTEGYSLGFDFYAGIGFPVVGAKNAHVGMAPSRSRSQSKGTNSFFDVDGDGLPDKVFIKDGQGFYRPNATDVRSGSVAFANDSEGLKSIPHFAAPSASESQTQSRSVQGLLVGITASVTQGKTDTRDMSYLSDVNGDGLVDLVNRGKVLFNTAQDSGRPDFSYNSLDTGIALGMVGGPVNNEMLPDVGDEKKAFEKDNPLMDNVRLWKAPYDGAVRVSGGVRLVDVMNDARFQASEKEERSRYKADGVRVAIQHNKTELWTASMGALDDADPYRTVQPQLGDIAVKKGDTLYFRVQSNEDGAYDIVAWSPTVEYVSNGQPATFMDANNLNAYRYQGADDFVLANRPLELSVPYQGTVKLAGVLNKSKVTSDDVTLQVTVIDYREEGGKIVASAPRVAANKLISRNYTGAIALDESFAVNRMSGVRIDFAVDSPIDLTALTWGDLSLPAERRTGMPELYYTEAYQEAVQPLAPAKLAVQDTLPANAEAVRPSANDQNSMVPILDDNGQPVVIPAQQLAVVDQNGEYIYKMAIKVNMDIYPVDDLGAPQEPWIAPRDGFILWTPWVSIDQSLIIDPLTQERRPDAEIQKSVPDGSVFVTAKRDGIRLAKHEIQVRNGDPTGAGYAGVQVLQVKAGDRIFFDATLRNTTLEKAVADSQVAIHYASDTPWTAPVTDHVNFVTVHQGGVPGVPQADEPPPDERAMVVIRKGDEIVYSKLMDFALAGKYALTVPQHVTAGEAWYVDVFTFNPALNVSYDTKVQYAGSDSFKTPRAGTLTFMPLLSFAEGGPDGAVVLAVNVDGVKRTERSYRITNGKVEPSTLPVVLDVAVNQTVTFDYQMDDALLAHLRGKAVVVDYAEPAVFEAVTIGAPSFTVAVPVKFAVQTNRVAAVRHAPLNDLYFGNPYRGWATAAYNGNETRKTLPIDEGVFALGSEADYKDTQKEALSWLTNAVLAQNPSNDGDSRWWLKQGHWGSTDDSWWVSPTEASSSRNGLDYFYDPQAEDFSEARTTGYVPASRPPKMSRSDILSYGGGFYLTATKSEVDMTSRLDVMDMNGDRFPDVVSDGTVQYTWADGTFFDTAGSGGAPRHTEDESISIGLGLGMPSSTANGKGEKPSFGDKVLAILSTLSISGSVSKGDNEVDYDLIDMNGDGLPDKVSKAGNGYSVRLNTGYAFLETADLWTAAADIVNKGDSTSVGGGGGYSSWNSMYGGGFNVSEGHNNTSTTLMDINGDGLPDLVIAAPDESLSVWLNTGAGFAPNKITWPKALRGYKDLDAKTSGEVTLSDGGSTSASMSGKYGFGFDVYAGPVPIFNLSFSFAGNVGQTISQPALSYMDVNGDGFVDGVRTASDDEMEVAISPIGRTNMLKAVQRPLGASIAVEYERSGNTYSMPQSRYVMSRVTVNDGHTGDGPDTLETRYRYDAKTAVYDRYERDFYGYRTVTEEQLDTGAGNVYRSVERTFHNGSYYTKGLLEKEVTFDQAGRTYLQTENTYKLRDEDAGNGLALSLPNDLAKSERARVFPLLAKTERSFHEGGQGKKSTYTTFEYDAHGNVNRFTDAGDEGSDDDVEALINYSVSCTDSYVVGKPLDITVIAAGGVMRQREGDVDCATGNLTQLRQAIGKGEVAQTDLAYYPDGNLRSVTGAANFKGQRYALAYEYDPAVATHVVQTHDSFGYQSSAAYDYRFGKPVSTTDLNGNVISTTYDTFGRTVSIHGPYEQGGEQGGSQATLRFAYFPDAAAPYAVTEHLNLDAAGQVKAPIDTVLFTDGIKRVLQTKKRAAVNGQTMMIVSGRMVFDGLGRTVEQYYPVVEPLGQAGVFNPANDERYHTTTEFDVLDRAVKTTLPDETVTTTAYGFGRDRDGRTQFSTVVTDANGNAKASYRDVSELITSVKEFNQGEALWTSYAYDPLKQIVEVKDVKGVRTLVEYDQLGRRTVIDNPDTGRTQTVYDPASNPVQKITANLAAAKKAISYDYEYNRLQAIHYPVNAANDVAYEYGGPSLLGNGSNQVGRLVQVNDASGSQELHYGRLGETVREIRTIASHTQGASKNSPEVYTTSYRYDSFGRLLELVLPDSEVVTYVYDAGGSLASFAGDKQGTHVSYLNLIHYDKFEQRTTLKLGNGIETNYTYDPASRRLDTLKSAGTRAGTFQNLHYGYDKVGNILNLHNQVDVPPPTTFGGPNQQSFGYDDLYRLTTAKGEYKSAPDKTRNYTLDLVYDTNHNILNKKQSDVVTVAGGSAIEQKGTSYDWQYAYAGAQPHAPTHIGNRTFSYDLNGNQTGWQSDVNGNRRFILWDEENRIAEIDDNGQQNRYVYDAKGERTVKLTKQGETVYVNQYYVVRNRSVVSKHLYAGSGRIVTHLVMGTAPGNEQRGAPGNGHGSDKTPTTPETGNGNSGNVVRGNNGDKEHGNNGLHLGQLKNGKENPGQGRDRRSDTANLHAQDVYKNPTLTGEMPGQGSENRSEQAGTVARNVRTSPLVITGGDASAELGGETSGGESVEGMTATFATPVVNGQSEFIWYYHPDHLGSTGFVTDQNGELYEHVEYFPFGETWVQEHSNTQRTPYLYTGKELDEETGLYYYGARYYDPRTSVWASADPILGEYLPTGNKERARKMPGSGGIFNPVNVNLYRYAANNPMIIIDPDGRCDMNVSDQYLEFLADYEKFVPKPYVGEDVNNQTVGYGHVILQGEDYSKGITPEQGKEILRQDLQPKVKAVNKLLGNQPVFQEEFDALVDFAFNVGQGALGRSELMKDVKLMGRANEPTPDQLNADFSAYSKVTDAANKKVFSTGVWRRRQDEWEMFTSGDYTRDYPKPSKNKKP